MKNIYVLIMAFFCCVCQLMAQNKNVRYLTSREIQALKEDTPMDVKISNYIFRKVDKNRHLSEFTTLDAIKLEHFFLGKSYTYACESRAIDKTLIVTTRLSFDHRSVVAELEQMGYIVTGLRSETRNITFAGQGKKCQDKAPLNADTTNPDGTDCTDCGKVQIKQELLNKFKDADYGAPAIDFDMGTTAPDGTSVASDQP